MDFARVYQAADRERLGAVIAGLGAAGVVAALFPSERAVDGWDVEVVDDQIEWAKEIVAAVLHTLNA